MLQGFKAPGGLTAASPVKAAPLLLLPEAAVTVSCASASCVISADVEPLLLRPVRIRRFIHQMHAHTKCRHDFGSPCAQVQLLGGDENPAAAIITYVRLLQVLDDGKHATTATQVGAWACLIMCAQKNSRPGVVPPVQEQRGGLF